MPDEKDQVTVAFENHDFALTPSPGEVILPLYGRKIHHDSKCGHLTDADRLPRFPDPDRLLWRRLIDSAPSHDTAARAEFARSTGLLGGSGQPLTSACSCVLRPVSPHQAATMRPWPLDEAVRAFDRDRFTAELRAMEGAAEEVRRDFPWEDWPTLPLERYALGQGDSAHTRPYCYLMEFGSKALGSIAGGSSTKHLIYQRNQDGSWWHDSRYADEKEAWQAVRSGIVAAVTAAREGRTADIDTIDAVRSGPALVAKTLRVYAPDVALAVYGHDVVRHFVQQLTGAPVPKLDRFALQARLKEVIDGEQRFAGWSYDLVVLFLYWWTNPVRTQQIVKIAPGANASLWDECRAGGFIAVGWDDVADLRSFADKDEFQAAFAAAYADEYNGYQSKISAKANEVWKLQSLRPGDLVVANKGTSEILGVGRVAGDGYTWREDRPLYRHTVEVEWDESYAGRLEEPERSWATVTVKDVSAQVWSRIRKAKAAPSSVGDDPAPDTTDAVLTTRPLDAGLVPLAEALDRRGQAVLYGPPGTGKTYTALRFAVRWLGELAGDLSDVDPYAEPGTPAFRRTLDALTAAGRLTMVAFHPNYGYEDFVEGFRPVKGGSGGLMLDRVDGVFKRVCQAAAADQGRPYLVVVDELNRGNLPKIFGELITLLEKDKRGCQVLLPLSQEQFTVPDNVYLVGTMNTADRSIRMLDAAIRRRFAFLEQLPDSAPLQGCHVEQLHLADLLDALNQRVRTHLDREKQIGQAFFLPNGAPVDTVPGLAAIVRDEILPLLQEYAYDDYSLLATFLGETLVDLEAHTVRELSDEGLVTALYTELQVKSGALE
ncbi:5-methylcytosine-specific restriction protein B [Streptomyces sp. SAI-135]|uniref:AAA family ATPase n=1 Tax=unclassified Streptomyces TaxID=2593676 RepID=UPI0024762BEB|nr:MULTISPECIES: AAA family ATPase [unclassified Streptomyces]MDH6516152.1 5-methylcytosine-specific restriction protein B [Streptomyces sp. SAI-090]MDH6619758.1 5-methylcytosine-specific restriction protein B [Streptomyces sp. SAI-135]